MRRSSQPSGPSSRGASLAVVYATVFLDLLGFGIILPSLYLFREVKRLFSGEPAEEQHTVPTHSMPD